jgi:hypothetical protein
LLDHDWRTDADRPTRGHEIHRWVTNHGDPLYAVVYDRPQVLDHQYERLVETTYYAGLQDAHAAALIAPLR